MGLEAIAGSMALNIMEISKIMKSKEKAPTSGKKAIDMKAIGLQIKCTAAELSRGQTAEFTKASTKTTSSTAKAAIPSAMAANM